MPSSLRRRTAADRVGSRSTDRPDSDLLDVRGLKSLGTVYAVKLDLVPFGQGTKTFHDDGGVMHEHILATVLRDESESLRVVEPLDRALRHRFRPRHLGAVWLGFGPDQRIRRAGPHDERTGWVSETTDWLGGAPGEHKSIVWPGPGFVNTVAGLGIRGGFLGSGDLTTATLNPKPRTM